MRPSSEEWKGRKAQRTASAGGSPNRVFLNIFPEKKIGKGGGPNASGLKDVRRAALFSALLALPTPVLFLVYRGGVQSDDGAMLLRLSLLLCGVALFAAARFYAAFARILRMPGFAVAAVSYVVPATSAVLGLAAALTLEHWLEYAPFLALALFSHWRLAFAPRRRGS